MQKERLDEILSDHALYQSMHGEEGAIANLRGAKLSGANLSGIDLSGADMSFAYLHGADLRGVNLSRADLSCAELIGADLRGANLRDTCLCEADLKDADLSGADFRYASLSRANLVGAKIDLNVEDGLLRKVALKILAEKGSFDNQVWHNSCNTVHCIAGHGCYLSEDRELENEYGTEAAGLLLLGIEAHGHFFDSTEDALGWLEEVVKRPVTSA